MKREKVSDAELEIMRCLWDAEGALPMNEIAKRVSAENAWDDSTVRTMVRRLCNKGFVEKEKREIFYFLPCISREEYSGEVAQGLIDRLFHGSGTKLFAALVDTALTDEELEEVRALLEKEK